MRAEHLEKTRQAHCLVDNGRAKIRPKVWTMLAKKERLVLESPRTKNERQKRRVPDVRLRIMMH